jgi:hypothetical protein
LAVDELLHRVGSTLRGDADSAQGVEQQVVLLSSVGDDRQNERGRAEGSDNREEKLRA